MSPIPYTRAAVPPKTAARSSTESPATSDPASAYTPA